MSTLKRKLIRSGCGIGLVAAPVVALAQESSTASATADETAATSSEVITLDEFIVRESAANLAGDLLPTSRPTFSVFGAQSIVDTPRSVTVLTPELMKQFNIQDFGDLANIGAGTQQANYYGVPGIPTIRGAKGGVYYNGMQRAFNRNEMPLSFGSLEGMDLVKGPAPSHFGAGLVGGYVNLIPKSPYFDEKRGSLNLEAGQYDSYRSQFDVGGPTLLLGRPAAYRISITGQQADSYYNDVGNDFVSLYGSVKAQLNKDTTLFTGAEFFNYKSNENAGWNRLTPELARSGRYVIGEPMSISDSRWGGNANVRLHTPTGQNGFAPTNTALVVSDAAVLSRFGTRAAAVAAGLRDMSDPAQRAAAYAGIAPADLANIAQTTTGFQYTPSFFANGNEAFTAQLDGSTVLADPADFANSQNFFWFGDLEFNGNPDRKVKYQTILEYISTEKRSSYGYAFDSEQFVNEHKLTITEGIDFWDTTLTYGASVRYNKAQQLQDFWAEPFSRRDITAPAISGNSKIFAGGLDPEGFNRWNSPFNNFNAEIGGNSVESETFINSAFVYTESKPVDRLTVYTSLLAAYAPYELSVPSEAQLGAPLVGPGDKHDKDFYSMSISPVIKITDNLNIYAMYQQGTSLDPLQGGAILGADSFAENKLTEVGAKVSLLEGRFFAGLSAYQWEQQGFNVLSSQTVDYEGEGVELEVTYKVTENFTVIGSANAQTVELGSPLGFRAAPTSEEGYALFGGELQTPFSQNQGGFDPSLLGIPANNPDLKVPGTPEVQLKLFAIYDFDNGLGISGGPIWSDGYYADYDRTIKLPATVVVNGSIYYRKPTWEITLSVENLTDEDYFSGTDPLFASAAIITKSPERNFRISYTYKF